MVELKQNMDSHSLEILRVARPGSEERKHVGYIQWHSNREPHIVISNAFDGLTLSELDAVISYYKHFRGIV